jgi:hypothetical protein
MIIPLPSPIVPELGSHVEIVFLATPLRGRVVGRAFGDPIRLDLVLPGGGKAADIPVNETLRILEDA